MSDFIGGSWRPGGGQTFQSFNPADGEKIWEGEQSTHVDLAVAAAEGALEDWAAAPVEERLDVILRFKELLEREQESLADLITTETGKVRWETAGEVSAMIAKIAISIEAFHERTGVRSKAAPGAQSITRHRPLGVVAVFGPYNFPGHLPNGHIIPALLAGNTVVFKPSELTPLVGQRTVELWEEAGIPNGVINLVQGAAEVGRALASAPDLDGLFFTGSAHVGRLLHRQFADYPGKMLALEMGGNNALVVGDVADMSAAVYQAISSAFASTGQRCTCARRLLIPSNASGDNFLDRFVEASTALTVGDPTTDVFLGPLISPKAASDLLTAQQTLVDLGGKLLLGMHRHSAGAAYVSPGIIDLTGVANVPDEEYFGPLVSVYRYETFDEAIQLANDTRFGLAAGLFDDDREKYERFMSRSTAGVVNWNRPTTGASSGAPFGGTGLSGNHRPAAYYAADYCAYPVASLEAETLSLPDELPPGVRL